MNEKSTVDAYYCSLIEIGDVRIEGVIIMSLNIQIWSLFAESFFSRNYIFLFGAIILINE